MSIALALGLHLLQWAGSFLTLDLFFRTIPVEPGALRQCLPGYRLRFGLVAFLASLLLGGVQGGLAGAVGWGLALLGWVPWWLLWRFGWRKQFTFLYKSDGGQNLP